MNPIVKQISAILLGVTILLILVSFLPSKFEDGANIFQQILMLAAEIMITVLVLDRFAERRERNFFFQSLLADAGSGSNGFALRAFALFKTNGWKDNAQSPNTWLYDGSLCNRSFPKADLKDIDLQGAVLQGIQLWGSTLKNASLRKADLTAANLNASNLSEADLKETILEDALLCSADLRDADLWRANLKGADLSEASLEGTILIEVLFDEETILPDGTNWTSKTDLSLFGAFVEDND